MSSETPRILHVEASTSYGGSVRALQMYLANCRKGEFIHDALLYRDNDSASILARLVSNLVTLHKRPKSDNPEPKQNPLKRTLRKLIPDSVVETGSEILAFLKSIPNSVRIFRFLKRSDYDLVHVNNTFSFQPATLIAAKLARVPVVAHVRNPQAPSVINKLLIRAVDHVVTVSRFHQRQVASWNAHVPVDTCYDSVEVPAADEQQATKIRRQFLGDRRFLVGSVGRLDEQKGYADLIRAMRYVADSRSDARLVIAGDGPLKTELHGLLREFGLDDCVELCGFRSDIPNFIRSLDLFVSSSHWEGLPLVVVEAMLLGVPVIATEVCGNSEVVLPGRTGKLVPDRDPVALAESITGALDELGKRNQDADEARKLASRLFAPAINAHSLDDIFRSALSGQHGDVHAAQVGGVSCPIR